MLYYRMGDYKACVVAFGNHLKDFPDTKYREELSYLTVKSWYMLALNSIEAKKAERFKASVDAYIKFIDAFPQSKYASEAESVYLSALQDLEKYNKPS